MKEAIEPLAAASHLLQALPGGILLTTRSGQRINTMTIAWGMLGIDWGLPMFITFVRTSRLSYEFLLDTPEFTINVAATWTRSPNSGCTSKRRKRSPCRASANCR